MIRDEIRKDSGTSSKHMNPLILKILHLAAVMALANITGSLLGTRLALRHGAGFVRGVFILVVSALILKTGYDAFLR